MANAAFRADDSQFFFNGNDDHHLQHANSIASDSTIIDNNASVELGLDKENMQPPENCRPEVNATTIPLQEQQLLDVSNFMFADMQVCADAELDVDWSRNARLQSIVATLKQLRRQHDNSLRRIKTNFNASMAKSNQLLQQTATSPQFNAGHMTGSTSPTQPENVINSNRQQAKSNFKLV